jgi:hypothetical protein
MSPDENTLLEIKNEHSQLKGSGMAFQNKIAKKILCKSLQPGQMIIELPHSTETGPC